MLTGDALVLRLQLGNGDTGKFPLAHVFDADGDELPDSPVALSHLANGLYFDASLVMPASNEVKVQFVCFDDSDHLTESTDQIISCDVIRQSSPIDSKLRLTLQLGDGNADKFPLANIFDEDGNEIAGSPVALTHLIRGLYINGALDFPGGEIALAQYVCFDDSGHTIQSTDQSMNLDEITKQSAAVTPVISSSNSMGLRMVLPAKTLKMNVKEVS